MHHVRWARHGFLPFVLAFHFAFNFALPAGEVTADPLKARIEELAKSRVGDHPATAQEADEAFDALLKHYEDKPLDQVRLVDFYFREVLLKRRSQFPPQAFREWAERGDGWVERLEGDGALTARSLLLPLWAEADFEAFVERSRALLAEAKGKADPWPKRRQEIWRRLLSALWNKPERAPEALEHFAVLVNDEEGDRALDPQRADSARGFLRDYKARHMEPGAFFDALRPLLPTALRSLNENDRRGAWTDLARVALLAGRHEDALAVVEEYESVFHPATALRVKALAGLGRWDELTAFVDRRLTWHPGSPYAFSALQAWAEAEGERGEQAKAEGLARLLWDVALTDAEVDRASQTLADLLMRRANPESVTAALAAHADAGGVAAVPRARGLPFQETLRKQALEVYPPDGLFRERALALLYAGEPEEALKAACLAYRSLESTPQDLERDIRLVAAALRARSGGMAAPRAFLLYQLHGPAGPDGQPGTGDDVARPDLPSSDWPPAKLHAAHRRMAGVLRAEALDGSFLNELVAYATALSLSGDSEGALGTARSAYAWARNRGEMDKAVTAVIAALRAHDGHLIRANRFLQFQIHGPAGPDKQPGTEDDLADPFAGADWVPPAAYAQELARLAEVAERRGAWRTLGHAFLLQGKPAEAVRAYGKARPGMLINADSATAHLTDLLVAGKAADGHPFNEKAVMDFFRFGVNGPDGEPGTADDLADPLADLKR